MKPCPASAGHGFLMEGDADEVEGGDADRFWVGDGGADRNIL